MLFVATSHSSVFFVVVCLGFFFFLYIFVYFLISLRKRDTCNAAVVYSNNTNLEIVQDAAFTIQQYLKIIFQHAVSVNSPFTELLIQSYI